MACGIELCNRTETGYGASDNRSLHALMRSLTLLSYCLQMIYCTGINYNASFPNIFLYLHNHWIDSTLS